jgi:hypothetical protein
MVGATGLLELKPPDAGSSMPDVQMYEITVEDGGRRNTVVLGDRELPPDLRELLAWVRTVPGRREQAGY